ncbi:MAG: CoA-binding protein [Candidatus Thermoplasmatota archaeon]|nr:CoA-binding protein [Candidatus Thermoplasmatota archaeon]
MDEFFDPVGVAIVGASSRPGKIGYEILKNVLSSQKKVYPVNPSAENILGVKCYPSVSSIKERVNLAVVATPSGKILDVVEDCRKKGIRAMVIISGGFKEVGNKEMEEKMVKAAKRHGMRIIGPNCIGIYNAKNGFNTFFQKGMGLPEYGNVAILTQSGTIGIGLLEKFAGNMGISKFVSYGNRADVDEIDMMKYLEKDDDTDVIAIYMESIKNGRKFFEELPDKPVIILKSGRTPLGENAAALHTGAMATNYNIFKGAARQYGAVTADSFEEFYDIIRIIATQPLPHGGKVGIITNGAGPCVIAADHIYNSKNLSLPELGRNMISEKLPSFAILSNPLDLTGSARAEHFLEGIRAMENDINIDIIMPFFVFQDAPLTDSLNKLYEGVKKLEHKKPIVAVSIGGGQEVEMMKHGIPLLEEPVRAIKSLDKIVGYARWKNENRSS